MIGPPLVILRPFFIFNDFLFFIFGEFGKWARTFERMGVQHLHFLKLAPTFGDFIFFQVFFAKFRGNLDLHIYFWNFSFMKK